MTLAHSFHVGNLRCIMLDGGLLRLDGGAMFGVVPKPLWSKRIAADERNRIPLAMRCLLIEHPDGLVLVDTGLGNKEDPKFMDIYGVENRGASGATRLEDSLLDLGYRPEEVRWVINSHLHFDHAGGNTRLAGDGSAEIVPAFPNATYVAQRRELEFAHSGNERIRASYLAHNFDPVTAAGKWKLIEGDVEILPGIRSRMTPGHIPYHQSILVQDRGETAIFLADIIPTSAHLPLPWIMGYDLEPLVTLETKRALLRQAVAEGWRLVFEHDPVVACGVAEPDGKQVGLRDVVTAHPG